MRPLAAHPFLLAAFPILFLYAHNVQQAISLGELLRPLAVTLSGTAVVMLVAWIAVRRDALKAGLVTSILVVLFFSYGQVFVAVRGKQIAGVVLGRHLVLLIVWGALAAAGVAAAVVMRNRLPGLTRALNVAAAVLVLTNVITAGWYKLTSNTGDAVLANNSLLQVAPDPALRFEGPAPRHLGYEPDIYYIIFDRYGSQEALEDEFGFDNHEFIDFLRAKGFLLPAKAMGNYPLTSHSLASALNMQYIQELIKPVVSDDYGPVYSLFRHYAVEEFLRSKGYRYVHMGSWWKPTASNPDADLEIDFPGLSEFSSTLLDSTILGALGDNIGQGLSNRRRHAARVMFEFQKFAEIRALPGPKFVFAHILTPHEPFVFDRNGNFLPHELPGTDAQRYVEQLVFANKKIMDMVNVLLSGPPDRRPIIILQADEGPFTGIALADVHTPAEMRDKFSILNAMFLPGAREIGAYDTITPVNTFRLVFDTYLGGHFPLLPNRQYIFPDRQHLYNFIDVTQQVQDG